MISYRMIMLIVGLVLVFILAIFTGFSTLNRDGWTVIPFLAVLAYFAYILKQVCEEWKMYRMDKKNGVEIEVLEFLNFFVEKSSSGIKYTRGSRITLAVFKEQLKEETLALRGDFSYIDLRPGSMYTVSFYRNAREIVKIEEFKRKR